MISTCFNIFTDNELDLTHYEYRLIYRNKVVGEYQLTFNKNKVTISIFKINNEFRGKGLSILALKEIDEKIYLFKDDFDFNIIEINVKSFNNSPLNNNQLISLYKKHFNMEVDYADKEEIFMKKEFIR